jgi:hypothetical protein
MVLVSGDPMLVSLTSAPPRHHHRAPSLTAIPNEFYQRTSRGPWHVALAPAPARAPAAVVINSPALVLPKIFHTCQPPSTPPLLLNSLTPSQTFLR